MQKLGEYKDDDDDVTTFDNDGDEKIDHNHGSTSSMLAGGYSIWKGRMNSEMVR